MNCIDYVLYKNGKIKPLKNKKIKRSKVKYIFMEIQSNLYGSLYKLINYDVYKKLRSITKVKLSYNFIDGEILDDPEYDEYSIVKNKYTFDNGREYLSKIMEIIISENILNNIFWVHECFCVYCYSNLNSKLWAKNIKKPISGFGKIAKYINEYKGSKEYKDILEISGNKFSFNKLNKKFIKNIKKSCDADKYFIKIYDNTYIGAEKKFLTDINSIDILSKNYILEFEKNDTVDDSIYNEYVTQYEKYIDQSLRDLMEMYWSQSVVSKLESNRDEYEYEIRSKITHINGKKIKKGKYKRYKDLDDFIYKYFYTAI